MAEYLKRLKELRLARGLSQKEIADFLGVSVAAYSLYERGNREPGIATIKKLAKFYNVSSDDLLEINEMPQTIAAHFDGTEYTEDELKEIRQFADFVKNRRNS